MLFQSDNELQSKHKINKFQRGLTLIELLVTLVISSFFVLGLTALFVENIKTAQVTQSLGASAEGGGFGSMFLSRYLRMAGQNNYASALNYESVINKVFLGLSKNNEGLNNLYDSVSIEYEAPTMGAGGGAFKSCAGVNAGAGETVREVFHVTDEKIFSCDSFNLSTGEESSAALIQGVEMFQVQYGLANKDYARDLTSYVNIDDVGSQIELNDRVRSIRFQLLVNSQQDTMSAEAKNRTFSLYDASAAFRAGGSFRVYGTTIALNNALRGRIIQ